MAYTPDPSLLAAIKQYVPQRLQAAALASALLESSGHAGAVGDRGTSFGYWQEHVGGRLTAAHHTPAMANNPVIAAQALAAEATGIARRHPNYDPVQVINAAQRGADPAGYDQRLRALLATTGQLLGQAPTTVPTVGAQPNATAVSTSGAGGGGLSPALMASLQQWLKTSSAAAAKGTYGGGLTDTPLFKQLLAARQSANEVTTPMVANAPTTGTSRYTGAIPGPIQGLDYPLGAKGPLIGEPYQGTHTLGNWESDRAVDIKVPVGTPVIAPEDGVIGSQIGALGSSSPRMAGLRVHLDGPADSFYFAHLSRLAVNAGQHVKAGQVIGYSGSANGVAHLHFASQKRDPRQYVGG